MLQKSTLQAQGLRAQWLRDRKSESSLNLVRPAGFEPTTFGFGNQHSIQMSYGRVLKKARKLQGEPEVILHHRARMTLSFGNHTLSCERICEARSITFFGQPVHAIAPRDANGFNRCLLNAILPTNFELLACCQGKGATIWRTFRH